MLGTTHFMSVPASGVDGCTSFQQIGEKMIQLKDVVLAIKELGGKAHLRQIYRSISQRCGILPDNYEDEKRAYIYHNSSDAKAYIKGNPDIFYKVGLGVWALRHPEEILAGKSREKILTLAYSMLTKEDLLGCAGDGQKLNDLVNQKIKDIKHRYNIS